VSYVYLDYADRQTQTIENIMTSLIKQLSLWKKSCKDVERLYVQCHKGKSRPDLSRLETTLRAICNRFERVFFILDALDECEDKTLSLLLEQLEGLDKSRCRIFLTSRPHLQLNFRDWPQIAIKAHESDIRLLIQKRIKNEAGLSELVNDNDDLKRTIVDKIIQNAKDM
jgi:hypothetical protein